MGHRITKVYTKVGDKGSTDLGNGSKILKSDIQIHLYGNLDELNSNIGYLIALTQQKFPIGVDYDLNLVNIISLLSDIQNLLFDLAGDVIIENRQSIKEDHVTWLEKWIDHFNDQLPPLKDFIIPGGNLASSFCHITRTVCRRSERSMVEYNNPISVHQFVHSKFNNLVDKNLLGIKFLNRLSDFLFVIARILNINSQEYLWKHEISLREPNDLSGK